MGASASGVSTSSDPNPFEVATEHCRSLLSTNTITRAQKKQIQTLFEGLKEGSADRDSTTKGYLCDLVRSFLVPANWADGSPTPCECEDCDGQGPNPQMCEADFLGRWADLIE
jgi:hypothetical protein